MKIKDIINLFIELSSPLNIPKFKLWWRYKISGQVDIITYATKDTKGIYKPLFVKAILIFEKIKTQYLGNKYVFLRHFIIATEDIEDLKGKIPSIFNTYLLNKRRQNFEGIVVCLHNDSSLIDYFQSTLNFSFSNSDNIFFQKEFNEPEIIILTKKINV